MRQLVDERVDGGRQLVCRHRLVDHPPRRRLGPGHRPAEQQQLLGPGHADQPGHQPGGPAVGCEASPHERQPEAAVLGGDGEVGGQRHLTAESRRPAADRADDRQLHLEQQGDDAVGLERCAPLHAPGPGLLPRHVGGHPVGPRTEIVAGAREHDDPERVVGRRGLEGLDDPADGVHVECALALGAVEGDAQHAVGRLDDHAAVVPVGRVRHSVTSHRSSGAPRGREFDHHGSSVRGGPRYGLLRRAGASFEAGIHGLPPHMRHQRRTRNIYRF